MRIMLIAIDAKFIHTNNAIRLLKANTDYPVDLFEYTIKDSHKKILADIKEQAPDVLAFSCYIWNIEQIKKLLVSLKEEPYQIVLGGPEVSYDSNNLIANGLADFIIRNEGELAFNLLLDAIDHKKPYSAIPNLIYKKNNEVVQTKLEEIKNLSILHAPYYFEEDIKHIQHKVAYIESSRGCPYKCSYCLSSLEKSVRFFQVEDVQKAILYLMNHGAKTVKFLDRTFNANTQTLSILDFIIEHHNNQTVFQFEITGDVLDPEIIDYVNQHAKKGMFRFEIGIQSTNKETNLLVDRFQNTEKLFSNIRRIQSKNIIDLHLDLIAGLPKEDLSSFQKTFDQVFLLGAKELQLGFLKFLKGTKIRNEAQKYKYRFEKRAPYQIIESDVLSKENLWLLSGVEHMLDIFHNKGYFGQHMRSYLLTLKSPFQFFKKAYLKANEKDLFENGYQLEDVYLFAFDMVKNEQIIYQLKQDYLLRSKVKPKIFWENNLSKEKRKNILEQVSNQTNHALHDLYKHSIILSNQANKMVVYYKDLQAYAYVLEK